MSSSRVQFQLCPVPARRARNLPETALRVTAPRPTSRLSTSAFHLRGCLVTWGAARRREPPAHRWRARVRGSCLLSSITRSRGALCPMRARALAGDRELAVKLQVSRPARQRAPAPSQGGSAGSNPVGATTTSPTRPPTCRNEGQGPCCVSDQVRPGPAVGGYLCPIRARVPWPPTRPSWAVIWGLDQSRQAARPEACG